MSADEEWDNELENGDSSEERYERMSFVVDRGQEPVRIDKFLITKIEGGTRNKLQQGIEKGFVLVNDKPVKSNYKIKPGDTVVMYSDTSPESTEIVPEPMDFNFVYEDDDVIVINKPAGMVVHPGCGNYTGTVVNGISWHLQQQNPELSEDSLPRFGLVHRIDKNTSGLLVLAKTEKASLKLAAQFAEHTVERKYVALVWGDLPEDEGTITGHVGRHQRFRKIMDVYPEGDHGKEAVTHYRVIERFGYVTLAECRLETGRTHQIRVHMQHIGHPLFNDDTYGGDRIVKGTVFTKYKQFVDNCFELCPRHALHAQTLGFVHPVTGKKMLFESELPEDIKGVIEKWRRYTGAKGTEVG
ncbi:MAG: RluA family pseudouridine synthase [Chitinophagaceae bacterium]|nr:RluA family pseudouridine synthase [Chitinophagaceae bacterium]MCW5925936.1 RluA family pseudouridine synthase [Chitinophagaceae bacterium]